MAPHKAVFSSGKRDKSNQASFQTCIFSVGDVAQKGRVGGDLPPEVGGGCGLESHHCFFGEKGAC